MLLARDSQSSPRPSSGRVESLKGTPDNRLTVFPPDDVPITSNRGVSHSTTATSPVGIPVSVFHSTITQKDKDPFVTSVQGVETRLSPTASSFSPFIGETSLCTRMSDRPLAAALSTDLGLSRNLVISSSTAVSLHEVEAWLTEVAADGNRFHSTWHIVSSSRFVCIHFLDIRDACTTQESIRRANREWNAAFANGCEAAQPQPVHGSPPLDCEDINHGISHARTPMMESDRTDTGQILIFVIVLPGSVIDPIRATDIVCRFLQSHGCLFAFVRQFTFPNGSFRAIVEFCDTGVACSALQDCNGRFATECIQIFATLYDPGPASASGLADAIGQASLGRATDMTNEGYELSSCSVRGDSADLHFHTPLAVYPFMLQSPFTSSMPYMLDPFLTTSQPSPVSPLTPYPPTYPVFNSVYQTPPSPALTTHNSHSPPRAFSGSGRADARRQNAMRVNRSNFHNVTTHHNHVDINRIREGIDVRTTIMLRNIPNKVDQAMLKRIVDESSWGKYDFMYLRIDFANDCNVGYAFINFVDPLDIIDFVNARGNQRWNCFKSDKVAEISYATIQGKDCLVQKFRNSSVMLEAPHYRPKLYFTSNGPVPGLAGQEEPFPEPDNQSKMKRSCENAEHVGLFTPNAGQHFRDEQRRRRSQYDRGTRLAALEEYDYEAAIQHMYGPSS